MQSNSYHDRRCAWWLAVLVASLGAVCCEAANSSHYHLLKSVTLGGSDGWDYITVDSNRFDPAGVTGTLTVVRELTPNDFGR